MPIKDKITESQRHIIDELAAYELALSRLYEKYSLFFPEMRKEWSILAAAEQSHYNLLKTMHKILDKGGMFFNLGRFGDDAVRPMREFVEKSLKLADKRGFKCEDAIATAMKIETSLVDSHFYDIVSSDAPEFKIIAERLSLDTKKHVETIREYFDLYGKQTESRNWLG